MSGITQAGDVSVTVNKAGYVFTPPTKTVTVLDVSEPDEQPPGGGVSVVFDRAESDGGGQYPTTALTLDFSAGIAGLSAGDITLIPVGNANKTITKGELKGEGPSCTLYVNGVAVEGWVDVRVNKAGYAVSGNPQRVAVHPAASVSLGGDILAPTEVEFIGLTADGEARVSETKNLTLEFSPGIPDLTAGDISLNPGGTGAQAVSLTWMSNTRYKLDVSGIAAEGDVSVIVNKAGHAFKPASRTVTVRQEGTQVDMAVWQTGGSAAAGASATTTGLALSFNPPIAGLDPGGITLTAQLKLKFDTSVTGLTEGSIELAGDAATGVTKGNLSASGDNKTWTLLLLPSREG